MAAHESVEDGYGARIGCVHAAYGFEAHGKREVALGEVADECGALGQVRLYDVVLLAAGLEQRLQHGLQVLRHVALRLPDHHVEELHGLDARGLDPVADVVQNARQDLARVLTDQLAAAEVRSTILDWK